MDFELWPQFSDFARFLCAFALNAESMEERHDKVETKGESCKNIVITTAETKIEICYK